MAQPLSTDLRIRLNYALANLGSGEELYNAINDLIDGGGAKFSVVADAGTSRVLALIDNRKYLRFTSGDPVSATISPQVTGKWVADSEMVIEQAGAGQVTIVAGSGVTIRNKADMTLKTAAQYAVVTLKRVAENEWVIGGDREAA